MKGLLLADELFASWDDLFSVEKKGPLANTAYSSWLPGLMGALSMVMWVAMALVGAAGGIYAIYVGIKMARADSAEAREENKKRLINIALTIVAVIVLILVFNVFLPMIIGAVVRAQYKDLTGKNPDGTTPTTAITTVVNTVRCLIGR